MNLRHYQQKAIESIEKKFEDGQRIFLLHLATGTGKTVTFGTFAINKLQQNPDKKILIIAHRQELLTQAGDKIGSIQNLLGTDYKIAYESGSNKLSEEEYKKANIIISSIQSVSRFNEMMQPTGRLSKYNPTDFQLVIIDETHHVISPSYLKFLDYFGLLYSAQNSIVEKAGYWNKDCILLGVTATPMRTKKGETLKQVFPEITYRYTLVDGIKEGYLCDIQSFVRKTNIKVGNIKQTAGDYNLKDLAEKINNPLRNNFILKTYQDYCEKNEPTLIFAVDVEHTIALALTFQNAGINAEYLTGQDCKEDRDSLVDRYTKGEIPVLVNCMVLTEGFDAPATKNIFLARPTRSPILYSQMIGRGTRIHPESGKTHCKVFDFLDAHSAKSRPYELLKTVGLQRGKAVNYLKKKKPSYDEETEPVNLVEIIKEYEDSFKRGAFSQEVETGELIDMGLLVGIVEEFEQSTIEDSKFAWIATSTGKWILPLKSPHTLPDFRQLKRAYFKCEEIYEGEYELSFEGMLDFQYHDKKINVTNDFRKIDKYISKKLEEWDMAEILFTKSAKWKDQPCSDGQKNYVWKLVNSNYKDRNYLSESELATLTKGQAAVIINLINYETNKARNRQA